MENFKEKLKIVFEHRDDLLSGAGTAYIPLQGEEYTAEKDLLVLYRDFVSELLKVCLAGVAVLGFLYKFLGSGGTLCTRTKFLGSASMIIFSLGAICALAFLYLSAEAYRYYVAGLRSKNHGDDKAADLCLEKRSVLVGVCIVSKAVSAISLTIGAILAGAAIIYQLWSI